MPAEWVAFALLTATAAVAAVTDVRFGKVYNALTYPAMAAGLLYWTLISVIAAPATGAPPWLAAVGGLLAGLVPFALLRLAGGIGGGDVKLMGAVGALSGTWACVLATAVYALIVGLVMGLSVMIYQRRTKQTLARLVGIALSTGAGSKTDVAGPESPQIPFGLAIAVGAVVAGAEQLLHWQSPWAWLSP
jgi:prepilin peptidase CpaA